MPGTYITPMTWNRRWWIDLSANDSPQWAEVSVGITSRGNSINEQSQEYYDMAGRGVAESEVTGVSVSRTFTGFRRFGDAAQDAIMDRLYDLDNRKVKFIECYDNLGSGKPNGRQGEGVLSITDDGSGDAQNRENISFGKPDATDEEIIRAAKEAKSWDFIRRLPQGLDTVLHEDSISQGQKQLLCITRVMLCLPPMLILDEATSSIDTRTELQVQEAFDNLMKGRTSFVVAHRLSTIRNASLILVMKDGKIIEQGTHEELLKEGGFYSHLYNSQFQAVS